MGVAGGKGPLRWVAKDAKRLKTGRIRPPQFGAVVASIDEYDSYTYLAVRSAQSGEAKEHAGMFI